jgi:predicted ATPase
MDQLTAILERAGGGQGGTLFLTGEAGIGKSRLAHEACSLARERGFLVLEARAYPLEGGLAYAPILAAFGPYLRRLDPNRRARLCSELAHLGRMFTDVRLPTPEPLGDRDLEKTRLFEAVARLLERIARETPVVLFLDDLHWADPASIELIHYLARGLSEQTVFLLGTYRVEDIDAAHGLRSLVTSLRRAGYSEELIVQRLDPDAVAELANSILGMEAPRELLALLDARAGGIPLIAEELIAALIDARQLVRNGGWTLGRDATTVLPSTLRDLILERLGRLNSTERRVTELVAVGGDAVPHSVLCLVSELDDTSILAAIYPLSTHGLFSQEHVGIGV